MLPSWLTGSPSFGCASDFSAPQSSPFRVIGHALCKDLRCLKFFKVWCFITEAQWPITVDKTIWHGEIGFPAAFLSVPSSAAARALLLLALFFRELSSTSLHGGCSRSSGDDKTLPCLAAKQRPRSTGAQVRGWVCWMFFTPSPFILPLIHFLYSPTYILQLGVIRSYYSRQLATSGELVTS